MSNTNDPKPDQPTPSGSDQPKPDAPAPHQSAFDFALPPEGGAPVPPVPTASDPDFGTAAVLPPRPEATRGTSQSAFEFTLSDAEFELPPQSGVGLTRPPRASDPVLPAAPPASAAGDSGVNIGAMPGSAPEVSAPYQPKPSSAMFELPPVPGAPAPSSTFELPPVPTPPSAPDIAAVLPGLAGPGTDRLPVAPDYAPVPTPLAEAGLKPVSSADFGPLAPPADDGSADALPLAVPDSSEDLPVGEPLSALDLTVTPVLPEPLPAAGAYASAFDFRLPDGANTYGDMPAPQVPSTSDPDLGTAAPLPPKPDAVRSATKNSFEFTLSDPDLEVPVELLTSTPKPPRPSGSTPDAAAATPPPAAPVASDPSAEVAYDAPAPDPVKPASDWLDSGPFPPAPAVPVAPAADISDIADAIAGPLPFAEPGEHSDVIAATIPGAAVPMSDAELDLNAPAEGESIHDMPAPVAPEGFDEPQYDLPAVDAADTGDASSILSDLTGDEPRRAGDSSGIRLEAPGVGRSTLGGANPDGFDLTLEDVPVPADLEAASGRAPVPPTDWEQQSDSDLFAERRETPAPRADADADDRTLEGMVSPIDPSIEPDQPSLTSDPQSIFSGGKPGTGSSVSAPPGSGSVRIGAPSDPNATAPRERPAAPRPASRRSSGDFKLPPAAPGEGAVDFDLAAADPGGSNATRGSSLSDVMRALNESDSGDVPTRERPKPGTDGSGSKVTVDWMAGSGESSAIHDAPPPPPARPAKRPAADPGTKAAPRRPAAADPAPEPKQKRESRSLLVGAVLGAVLAGGASAGVFYSGLLDSKPSGGGTAGPVTPPPGTSVPPPGTAAAALDPRAALLAGDTAAALAQLKDPPQTPAAAAAHGQVRLFARIRAAGPDPVPANDPELLKAREHLETALKDDAADPDAVKRAVAAAVQLGVSYEVAGDPAKARAVFAQNRDRFKEHRAVFDALLDRLDAAEKPAGGPLSRLDPADAERLLLALAVALVQDPPAADEPAEAGPFYWKAVNRAAAGQYAEAQKLLAQAKAAHVARAKALAGRGLNPLTDPLEQMFPRACDELSAYWALCAKLYGNQALAAAIKRDGFDKALAGFATAQAELAKAQGGLTAANTELTKAKGDLKTAQTAATTAQALLETEKKAKDAALLAAKDAGDKLATAETALAAEKKRAADATGALAAVAKELKVEKPDAAGLIAAARAAANRGTGPDLSKLALPPMVAMGGGALTVGQYLEMAERFAKAERSATDAIAKLSGDTMALTEAHKKELAKQQEAGEAALKKQADKFTEDARAAAKAHADALAAEVKKADAARQLLKNQEAAFQAQLKNAVTPTQVMELWLPVLTELRRASDAPAARAAADKALAAAAPDSEDAAKAQTVAGMARLNAGDLSGAKDQFQAARRNPAFELNREKPWAKTVVAGLEAVTDPVALYRLPVVLPPTDSRLAARALDAGVAAYRAERFGAAVRALTEAAKNDPADPVAWYYLGAAKWAQGDEGEARKDFAQGAEREKRSPVPARAVSAALAPIQGAARDAIDRARP